MNTSSASNLLARVLPWAGALAAGLSIASAPWALGLPWLNFVFKPIATLCVIAWARRRPVGDAAVRRWILAGLWASLGGDVALLWPVQGFLPGLVSFLVAHLCYLVAFTRRVRLAARWLPFAAYGAVAAAVLARLWPGVPAELHVPVAVYVVALGAMAAQAAVAWRAGQGGALPALGGALFLLSDATLATDRFAGGVPLAGLWILASYWAAQWLIARAPEHGLDDGHKPA